MLAPISFRYFIWIFLFYLPLIGKGNSLLISKEDRNKTIKLQPFLSAFEDSQGTYNAQSVIKQIDRFTPLDRFNLTEPDHVFWLATTLITNGNLDEKHFNISFNHLTFVDLYIFKDGQLVAHRKAGSFRIKSEIAPSDNRFNFNIELNPGSTYQLLLKVHHTKKYKPNINFILQSTYTYLLYNRGVDLIDSWLQGAIAILFLYTGLSWIISLYRPFLWVTLFILGVGLYCFSLQPAFTDFFFPMNPELGWLFVPGFLHLGVIGFYLLMLDFLELKKNAPLLYKYGHLIIKGILIFTVLRFIYNSFSPNYYLANQINQSFVVIHLVYFIYTPILLWRKLDTSQRFMLYGVFSFIIGSIILVGGVYVFSEQGLVYAPITSKITIILITTLFLSSINQKLRQHEREKIAALEQLNEFHKEQNSLIERKVGERTAELRTMNGMLQKKQSELIEKNRHIDTLMDELSHRVKNNLQVLYSLSALQLPNMRNEKGKHALNDMRGRIKAMMLVNEHLNIAKEQRAVQLYILVEEIKEHLQKIYDPLEKIRIEVNISNNLLLNANSSLSFGLILTELFTNTFKHAFHPEKLDASIKLILYLEADYFHCTYCDNGKGVDKLKTNSSMGISLIYDLIRQLKGTLTIDHHTGFTYSFTFPNTP